MGYFDSLERFGKEPAIISLDSYPITYSQVAAEADEVASNCLPRSLVFCLCENSIASLIGYLGFLRRRVVPLLLADNINPELLDQLVDIYQPDYLWLPETKLKSNSEINVICRLKNYILIQTGQKNLLEIHPDLAQLMTTSGSTGSPKLVRQSYGNLESNLAAIINYLGIKKSDRPITSLPMNYSYGLSVLSSHLSRGCGILLTNKTLIDKEFWVLLRNGQCTIFAGVPYSYEILKKLRFDKLNLPKSMRVMTVAGGKLSVELTKEFLALCAEKNINFIVMYGQTEATARMSWLPPEHAFNKVGSIGLPIPGGTFSIIDENGKTIDEVGKVGELNYYGANVTLGYAECRADLSLGDENFGCLQTGDLAYRDSEGFYYIVGRKNRVIKLFGNRINLDEIEKLVFNMGYSCVCTGSDENCKIYTTNKNNHKDIKTKLAYLTNLNPVAFDIKHINAIPRNEAGKVIYAALP